MASYLAFFFFICKKPLGTQPLYFSEIIVSKDSFFQDMSKDIFMKTGGKPLNKTIFQWTLLVLEEKFQTKTESITGTKVFYLEQKHDPPWMAKCLML